MIIATDTLPDGHSPRYDICVVGSGPAALTIAEEFLRRGRRGPTLRVALLEGGREEPALPRPPTGAWTSIGRLHRSLTSDVQHLYKGSAAGWIGQSKPDYLTESRLRGVGGSSWIWSGWWCPVEPQDLEPRPGRPDVCWPLGYNEVHPYYLRVHEAYGLGPFRYDDLSYWAGCLPALNVFPLPEGRHPMRSRIVLFKRVNFWQRVKARLRLSSDVDVFLNANVVGFEGASAGGGRERLTAAVARTLEMGRPGRYLRIHASRFVIAAGALESTRLLLATQRGNSSGQVGRNFVEHPYLWVAGRFTLGDVDDRVRRLYFAEAPLRVRGRLAMIGALVPKPDLIRARRVGNFRVLLGGAPGSPGTLNACWEQFPAAGNRVELAPDAPPDQFGLPQLRVESVLTPDDSTTVRTMLEASREVLEELGLGREFEGADPDRLCHTGSLGRVTPGNHPMGVTRMSDSPSSGVVDRDLRLHDVVNGYVLSTGAFPTAGYANPTLTLAAFAIRLADHLQSTFGVTSDGPGTGR